MAADPMPGAEVGFGVFEYSYLPILAVQKAVCLSWPMPEDEFVVESAPAADGPWTVVVEGHWVLVEGRQQVLHRL